MSSHEYMQNSDQIVFYRELCLKSSIDCQQEDSVLLQLCKDDWFFYTYRIIGWGNVSIVLRHLLPLAEWQGAKNGMK